MKPKNTSGYDSSTSQQEKKKQAKIHIILQIPLPFFGGSIPSGHHGLSFGRSISLTNALGRGGSIRAKIWDARSWINAL